MDECSKISTSPWHALSFTIHETHGANDWTTQTHIKQQEAGKINTYHIMVRMSDTGRNG